MRNRSLEFTLAFTVAVATSCGSNTKPAVVDPGPPGPTASEQLASVSDDMWKHMLADNPTMATQLGVPGYDDKLPDVSAEGIARSRAEARALLDRAEAIDVAQLTEDERITRAILVHELRSDLESAVCKQEQWTVDHLWGPQVWFLNLGDQTRVETAEDEDNYILRLNKFGSYVDQRIATLRTGLADGLVAPGLNVERSLRQLDELVMLPAEDMALLGADRLVPDERKAAFRKRIVSSIQTIVRPAYERYRAVLVEELSPAARDTVGVGALPFGDECYRARIRAHTSRDDSPQQLHDLGLSEMKRIRGEMETLAAVLFPGKPLPDVLKMLRDDPKYGFETRDEVEKAAVAAVRRAEAKLPEVFSVLPKAPVQVKRLEPHAEKDSPMAYYRNPSADGKQPGTYFVNTYLPEQRPRYTAEVLAFHEAVPGHHLQIAIAMELDDIPEFQKHAGTTAFVEGWALYAERLCDEMGLYTGDMDRLGMLSFDAWRAARLVVDTGMHSLGWTRQQAIDYMLANTASTLPDIENEVDRYITWPGQALAYKVGQLEILRLREQQKKALGDRFDLRLFHQQVLENGAVPLSVLDERFAN
jgi:uncharacterized protein (DUF885 family)